MDKRFFLGLVILFALHTLEEILTAFWSTDPSIISLATHLGVQPFAIYSVIQIVAYIFLVVLSLLLHTRYERWTLPLLGFVLISEFSHPIAAIQVGGYVPGLVTGTALAIAGVLFWTGMWDRMSAHGN